MADSFVIEIRLVGDGMTPETLRSRDVGDLIASIEQMIASLVARDNPALGLGDDEVVVGLASIQQGSYVMQFQTLYRAEVEAAYSIINQSIRDQAFETLPSKSLEALKKVRTFTRKYKTEAQFWERSEQYRQQSVVTQNTKIDVDIRTISSRTVLYGLLTAVGGEEPPRARLRLLNGTVLSCHITRKETYRIARELGQRLYTVVGVEGIARWNSRDMVLDHFLIEKLTPFVPKSVTEAVDNLSRVAGAYYDDIDDIDQFIADARGNDEEF